MGKAFYGWYMVMFNLLVLASGTGLVNNSAGQFLKPLTEALGIARSEASLYNSCLTVVMILLVPQLTKLFKAARPRVWSTLGVFCVAGGWFCLSFAQISGTCTCAPPLSGWGCRLPAPPWWS